VSKSLKLNKDREEEQNKTNKVNLHLVCVTLVLLVRMVIKFKTFERIAITELPPLLFLCLISK
jgi:hypothetical protein